MNKQEELPCQVASSTPAPDFDNELSNLRLERDNAITFLSTVQNSLAEHSQQLLIAQKIIETKDTYIASLLSEHQNLRDSIGIKDSYIRSLQEELGKLQHLIAQKDAYLRSLEQERPNLNNSITVKDTYIASLLDEHRKLSDLLNEKDRYIHSLLAEYTKR